VCGASVTTGGFAAFDPLSSQPSWNLGSDCWDGLASLEEEGFTEFITVKYDREVYIKDIEIGENRGAGSVVSLEAFDYSTKQWHVMWSGPPAVDEHTIHQTTGQFRFFRPYPLCQPRFKTDIVKLKLNTKAVDGWNEFDYVKLVGSEEATPGALLGSSVIYEPPSGVLDCVESFTFSMSDCGGQRSRSSESQTYTILPAGGGTKACGPLKDTKDGVATGVVVGIVGGAVALLLVLAAANYLKERKLRKAEEKRVVAEMQAELEKVKGELFHQENTKLKIDVAIMQEYNKEEVHMLENQIQKFTEEMAVAERGTEGVTKDMARLLIKAEELVGKVVIGEGAFGEVYKSNYRGTAVAVKTMKQVDEETLDRFQSEIMLMSGLRHQNIVTMVGCCWEKDLMALVMEFCEKGTSTDVLKAEGDQLTWDDPLFKWLLDVSRGVNFLHGMSYYDAKREQQVEGIIHRDLKPDNCLVTETWGIKISDFGEARAAAENATMTQVGTPIYIAPEVVKGEHYSTQADVYSFGMTLLQFCLKKKNVLDFLKQKFSERFKKRVPNISGITHEMLIKGWRPDLVGIEGTPQCVVDLLGMCWVSSHTHTCEWRLFVLTCVTLFVHTCVWQEEYADTRPTFGEIVEYVQMEVRNEVMGAEAGGVGAESNGSRRTSCTGGLGMRIKMAKAKRSERSERESNLTGTLEEENKELQEKNHELEKELRELRAGEEGRE